MHTFHVLGILITLTTVFAYINYRFLRFPATIGLMLLSLLLAGLLILLAQFGLNLVHPARLFVVGLNFNEFLLQGLLSFLLFAGALFVNVDELADVKLDVAIFALAGTILSTVLIGLGLYGLSLGLGLHIRPAHAFLFGALISPTDPVAVLPTLQRANIPRDLRARIEGEALFNDGIGIVLFLTVLSFSTSGAIPLTAGAVAMLFVRQAAGGLALGTGLGFIGNAILKTIDNYQLEILITLAVVSGGYSLSTVLGVSGPLAMVMASLIIGTHGRQWAMSADTRDHLDRFWQLVNQVLNAVLFTVIGLEVLTIYHELSLQQFLIGAAAIPIVLAGRFLSVGVLIQLLRLRRPFARGATVIMTWSGIRAGIPIALALTIPPSPDRNTLIIATYLVVVFSMLIQATTIKFLVRAL